MDLICRQPRVAATGPYGEVDRRIRVLEMMSIDIGGRIAHTRIQQYNTFTSRELEAMNSALDVRTLVVH